MLVLLGAKKLNSLSSYLKSTNNINLFKHMTKDTFFKNTHREENDATVLLKPRVLSHIHVSAFLKIIYCPKTHKNVLFIISCNHF